MIKNTHLYLLCFWKGEHISMLGIFTMGRNLMLQGDKQEEEQKDTHTQLKQLNTDYQIYTY